MAGALRNWIVRRLRPRELTERDALEIYNIISSDPDMVGDLKETMKVRAGSRMGLYALALSWNGTRLTEYSHTRIARRFRFPDLANRNLTTPGGPVGSVFIELGVLASALPEKLVVLEHFEFDMGAEAAKIGVTLDEVRDLLREIVVGFGVDDYGNEEVRFRDCKKTQDSFNVLASVLGVGGLMDGGKPYLTSYSRAAIQNIKKLMEDDKIFTEKFDFLKTLN